MPRWLVVVLVTVGALTVLAPVGVFVGYVYVSGTIHEDMRFPEDDVALATCVTDPVSGRPTARVELEEGVPAGAYTVGVDFLDTSEAGRGAVVDAGSVVLSTGPEGPRRAVLVGAKRFGGGELGCGVSGLVPVGAGAAGSPEGGGPDADGGP
ncbi:hypothetical protein [Streptomyces showdoensis]|uniref:hypothetical protein n=1 Tax=Streptomyces showdoensis TaxID=68268 RepID=UPI000F506CB0|nr:hypothetical protein [Streptomyces showdoensis]